MTEKDYEKEEFRLYVTGFNGHNPFYKQTAYLDFRWRLLDLHEIQLTKHVACAIWFVEQEISGVIPQILKHHQFTIKA